METDVATAPRKWWIAGILSLVTPGLGQVYNGQIYKAIIFFFGPLLLLPPGIYVMLHDLNKTLLILGVLLAVLYRMAVVGDTIVVATRTGAFYSANKFNKWYIYLVLLGLGLGFNSILANYIRSSYVQAFNFPSGSMEPTLLAGDHVLADKRPSARNPRQGDLVVFIYPIDPEKDFLKRVVAVGGDKVEIVNKELLVNDKPVKENYVVHSDSNMIPVKLSPRDNFGPFVVPQNSCFVLGDNRDTSYDSRFWGAVDITKIKGKVISIYWSWNKTEGSIRWDRIGLKLQ